MDQCDDTGTHGRPAGDPPGVISEQEDGGHRENPLTQNSGTESHFEISDDHSRLHHDRGHDDVAWPWRSETEADDHVVGDAFETQGEEEREPDEETQLEPGG